MREQLNCPNCGAPIDGDKCKYCGTSFINTLSLDMSNTQYLKIRIGDKTVITKVYLENMTVNYEPYDFCEARDMDGRIVRIKPSRTARYNLEFVSFGE